MNKPRMTDRLAEAERLGMDRAAGIARANGANYPIGVFVPPTQAQAREANALLRTIGLSLDKFSAECCRMASENIAAAIQDEAAKLKESR